MCFGDPASQLISNNEHVSTVCSRMKSGSHDGWSLCRKKRWKSVHGYVSVVMESAIQNLGHKRKRRRRKRQYYGRRGILICEMQPISTLDSRLTVLVDWV